MKSNKFSLQKRLKSFGFAFNGLIILFREEHNARIHFVASFVAVIAAFWLKLSAIEWVAIIFAIGLVIALEIINSAIENIADFISPEKHEMIKKIKDLAAAGVLVASITALMIGLIVFLPKIIDKVLPHVK
jgi:diacylglycerol kinase